MFRGFARVWTPVELSARLKARPVGLSVAGTRVVLFRDTAGRAGALLDQCPHRGVALSLGQVTPEGTIACPFHGWEFHTDGSCARVPNAPAARCEHLGATALPVVERGGMVWIYTAPGPAPMEGPTLDETLADDVNFARDGFVVTWRCHWTRAMENMLDMPHLPFIHRASIGVPFSHRMARQSETLVTYEPTATGGRSRAYMDGQEDKGYLEFTRPNLMTLRIPVPGLTLGLHVYCVPLDAGHTRLIMMNVRDFALKAPIGAVVSFFNARVGLEDQAVVESSYPVEVPPASEERSVAYDAPTLRFRTYYDEHLRASEVGAASPVPQPLPMPPAKRRDRPLKQRFDLWVGAMGWRMFFLLEAYGRFFPARRRPLPQDPAAP